MTTKAALEAQSRRREERKTEAIDSYSLGRSVTTIAYDLGVSKRTVQRYLKGLLPGPRRGR